MTLAPREVELLSLDFRTNTIAARRALALEAPFANLLLHRESAVLIAGKSAFRLQKTAVVAALESEDAKLSAEKVHDHCMYHRIVNNKGDEDESFRGSADQPTWFPA